MPRSKKKALDFEQALTDLEQLVDRMEGGDLSLEESLKEFEQGIQLVRQCQGELDAAEQKVAMLVQRNGEEQAIEFDPETGQLGE